MSDSMLKLPYPLQDLLNEGYVLWFTRGRSKERYNEPKTGQQFWLEDGELLTHNVHPYHKKELKTGSRAWRVLENELKHYAHVNFDFRIVGQKNHWHQYNENGLYKSIDTAVKQALKYIEMPTPPAHISTYALIEEMVPDTVLTFHKRKQPNLNAFRAGDAKTVVFKWLHKRYPDAVIVPEFGIGGVWGKTSIVDMAVFDTKKMIFVEIKAETDSFVRVQKQLEVSSQFADEVWLALFESKHIPENIPLHVGIITFDSKGKINIIKKPKLLKQDKTAIGHIWTKELKDEFSFYPNFNHWFKNLCKGIDDLTNIASYILGGNARQFTINTWRKRFFIEFIWRRDLLLRGNYSVVSLSREGRKNKKEVNVSNSYFHQNYDWDKHGLHEAGLKELAMNEWKPSSQKREIKAIPFKERMAMAREQVKINQIIKEEQ